ncbi:hypothetical protein W97_04941 [Coniosporium apollinis CBS 100218]|uniref:Uncharacterized protein n=1 Tax=Coniosporium apollinis (strain CBS 100218) TaxID=1168221 RepID=R7YUW8_CONA1|nr:uncharacterized protein W97_04941 [Coniosporium apollinis CBS 100218]EON65702.1 hypothetical protein W97_04941 [Coniosporium apollinis CBS 100218]
MSDDGARPKKKKGARVSFDEDTVGFDRGDDSPTSSRGGGMESSRWSGTTAAANEQDYGLKPMPALPSFGSIRSQRRQEEPEIIEKVTETAPSSMSTSISTLAEPMGPSSDHAVGGIFARDYATKQTTESKRRSAEPANAVSVNPAPATTSSSSSTFDSDQSRDNTGSKPSPQVEPQRSSSVSSHTLAFAASIVGEAESNPSHDDGIPSISLEPPTPKAEEYDEAPDYVMPGGWDEDAFHRARTGPVETQQWIAEPTAEPKSSTETAAEPVAVEAAPVAVTDVPPIARPQRGRQLTAVTEEASSDDDDSIYSDAEENLDEDDRGFSSLNAIANSPIGPSSPRMAVATPPDSPVVAAPPQQGRLSNWLPSQSVESSPSDTAEDWNQSRAYWSSLNEQRKQQLEHEALAASSPSVQPALSEPAPSEPTQALPASKPKKRINAVPQQAPPTPLAASKASAPRSQQPSQPKAPAMRQSLRAPFEPTAAEQPATHMRKSMRGDDAARTMRGGNTMRTSMRSVEPESARPASPPAQAPAARGALQKKNIPSAPTMRSIPPPQTATAAKNRASAMPALGRKMSDDSVASASSFRKQRRRTSDTGGAGGYTMKRSMRGSSQPAPIEQRPVSPTPPPTKSSRFSIRSLSPTGSFMRRPMTGSAIRASLDTGAPTLRPQSAKPEKASKISGFGKSSKPKAPAPKAASRYESRFGDSSDDEDARPTFRSRFADSDDEDDAPVPTGLTPVRGIPRRAGDEDRDSTDLSDEESDSGRRPKQHPPVPTSADVSQAASARPMTNGNPQGAALASGTLRDSSKPTAELPNGFPGTKPKPKRGFFGMGKKKPASEPLGRPITPIDAKQMADNAMAQSPSGAASPRSPRLHRRNTPTMQRMESDTWPLPAPPAIGGEERPATADGAPVVVKPQRPEIGARRSTYDEKGNVLGRSGKKKKFQFLRKAFRLDD